VNERALQRGGVLTSSMGVEGRGPGCKSYTGSADTLHIYPQWRVGAGAEGVSDGLLQNTTMCRNGLDHSSERRARGYKKGLWRAG
jgi:hypothetical protein